jgi:hypothetical protein
VRAVSLSPSSFVPPLDFVVFSLLSPVQEKVISPCLCAQLTYASRTAKMLVKKIPAKVSAPPPLTAMTVRGHSSTIGITYRISEEDNLLA